MFTMTFRSAISPLSTTVIESRAPFGFESGIRTGVLSMLQCCEAAAGDGVGVCVVVLPGDAVVGFGVGVGGADVGVAGNGVGVIRAGVGGVGAGVGAGPCNALTTAAISSSMVTIPSPSPSASGQS